MCCHYYWTDLCVCKPYVKVQGYRGVSTISYLSTEQLLKFEEWVTTRVSNPPKEIDLQTVDNSITEAQKRATSI